MCLEDETLLVKIKVIQEEALQRPFGFGEFVGPFMVSVLHSQPKSHSAKTEKTDLVSIFFFTFTGSNVLAAFQSGFIQRLFPSLFFDYT